MIQNIEIVNQIIEIFNNEFEIEEEVKNNLKEKITNILDGLTISKKVIKKQQLSEIVETKEEKKKEEKKKVVETKEEKTYTNKTIEELAKLSVEDLKISCKNFNIKFVSNDRKNILIARLKNIDIKNLDEIKKIEDIMINNKVVRNTTKTKKSENKSEKNSVIEKHNSGKVNVSPGKFGLEATIENNKYVLNSEQKFDGRISEDKTKKLKLSKKDIELIKFHYPSAIINFDSVEECLDQDNILDEDPMSVKDIVEDPLSDEEYPEEE